MTAFRDPDYTFDTTPWPTHVTLENFQNALSTSSGQQLRPGARQQPDHRRRHHRRSPWSSASSPPTRWRASSSGASTWSSGIILGASMFPVVALVTPLFQLFTDIGWIGTYQAMIIPNISFVLPLTVYTLTSFFAELPWELEEAARIDGASRGQAFRLVMLPLAAPALFTTAILAFIAAVNEYLLASLLSSDATEPVTVAIARFSGNDPHVVPYAAIMAAGTIVTIPLVIMVLLFQRRIISGLTAGGVKS